MTTQNEPDNTTDSGTCCKQRKHRDIPPGPGKRILRELRQGLRIPWDTSEDERRRRLLNMLLIIITATALAVVLFGFITSLIFKQSGTPGFRMLYLGGLIAILGNGGVLVLNHFSSHWASWLFLLMLSLVSVFSDTPQQIANGRTLIGLAVPVILASFLLRPAISFFVAGLGSTIVIIVAVTQNIPPPAVSVLFVVALLSALLAHILEGTLRDWRITNQNLGQLNQASQSLSATLDLDQVLVTFLDQVRELLDVVACSVWLSDQESGAVVCRQASGPQSELVRGWRLASGAGIAGQVVRNGQPLIVADAWTSPEHFPGVDQQTGLGIRSIIGVPLEIQRRVIGALEVVDTAIGRFGSRDLALLESLAVSAAIAIENARLYERAQREIAQRKQAEKALRESEARFRGLFDGVPVGLFQSTPEGQVIDVNPAYVQILGYPSREAVLKTNASALYVNPEQRKAWRDLVEQQDVVESFEMHGRRYDGETIWVRESSRTVRNAQGKVLYYEGAVTDITEEKRAAEQIHHQAEALSALHETALALATQQDLPDLLQAIVARAVGLLDATGGGLYLYRPETADLELMFAHNLIRDQVGAVLQPGEGLSGRVLVSRKPIVVDNYNLWEGRAEAFSPVGRPACLAVPILWAERPLGVLYLVDDLPRAFTAEDTALLERFAPLAAAALETRRLVDDLQDQMEELQNTQSQLIQSAKLAAIGELAAGVAHEINNPLTSVLGYAEIAMADMNPHDSCRRDLEAIASEALRACEIVRNLLDFSRQTEPRKEPADVNEILQQSLAVIRYHLTTSGLKIQEDYAQDLSPIPLDTSKMRQVFLNLITNAFQAMPHGGRLAIRTRRVEEQVAVDFCDTGEGIPPANLTRIFDPFFSTKPSGTGLGLSVSLGIVHEHEGHITVESRVGQGSTFTVWLPFSPQADSGAL